MRYCSDACNFPVASLVSLFAGLYLISLTVLKWLFLGTKGHSGLRLNLVFPRDLCLAPSYISFSPLTSLPHLLNLELLATFMLMMLKLLVMVQRLNSSP